MCFLQFAYFSLSLRPASAVPIQLEKEVSKLAKCMIPQEACNLRHIYHFTTLAAAQLAPCLTIRIPYYHIVGDLQATIYNELLLLRLIKMQSAETERWQAGDKGKPVMMDFCSSAA